MKLYLVQHAKAASAEQDPERPLTEEGLRGVRKIAAFIRPLNLCIDYLWHSGKKRALQTAEVLAAVVTVNEALEMHENLSPNDDITVLSDELAGLDGDIMIVGHLPFLARLASLLVTGRAATELVTFKNAGIVALNRNDEGRWQIGWMITPELVT